MITIYLVQLSFHWHLHCCSSVASSQVFRHKQKTKEQVEQPAFVQLHYCLKKASIIRTSESMTAPEWLSLVIWESTWREKCFTQRKSKRTLREEHGGIGWGMFGIRPGLFLQPSDMSGPFWEDPASCYPERPPLKRHESPSSCHRCTYNTPEMYHCHVEPA